MDFPLHHACESVADLVKLGFDPVDMMLFIDDDVFKQLAAGVVVSI